MGSYEELLKLDPSNVESIHVLPSGSDSPEEPQEEEKSDEPETKYKFGSTQVNLPDGSPAQVAIVAMQDSIPESALAGKGKDVDDPHVTLRYGLRTSVTPELRKFIESQPSFEAKLGQTTSFPPSKHSDGAAPIIAPVVSDELHRLNKEIEHHGDFEPSSFPDYRPHVTIAYVKPEVAKFYQGMKGAEGKTFPIDSVMVSDKDGDKVEISLKSPSAEQDESNPSLEKNTSMDVKDKTPEPVVVKSPTTVPIQTTRLVPVPLQTAIPDVSVTTKTILPLAQVKAMAAGLNTHRQVKSVRELMQEASQRNPTKMIP